MTVNLEVDGTVYAVGHLQVESIKRLLVSDKEKALSILGRFESKPAEKKTEAPSPSFGSIPFGGEVNAGDD